MPNYLSTNSGRATKRLDRLTPNLAHMCRFICEWIYAKQSEPQDKRGHFGGGGGGGFRGSQIQKSGRLSNAGPIGTKFGTRLRIRLGMDIGLIHFAPRHWGGGG